jgi:hypothetical protein
MLPVWKSGEYRWLKDADAQGMQGFTGEDAAALFVASKSRSRRVQFPSVATGTPNRRAASCWPTACASLD